MSNAAIPSLVGIKCWCVGKRDETDDLAEQPGEFAVKLTFDDPDQAHAWLKWIMANHPDYQGSRPDYEGPPP